MPIGTNLLFLPVSFLINLESEGRFSLIGKIKDSIKPGEHNLLGSGDVV